MIDRAEFTRLAAVSATQPLKYHHPSAARSELAGLGTLTNQRRQIVFESDGESKIASAPVLGVSKDKPEPRHNWLSPFAQIHLLNDLNHAPPSKSSSFHLDQLN